MLIQECEEEVEAVEYVGVRGFAKSPIMVYPSSQISTITALKKAMTSTVLPS